MSHSKYTSEEKHRFDEERARRILLLCFPEKYEQAILADSPDIIDEKMGIGVEVTDCINQDIQKGFAWASAISGKRYEELTEKSKKHILSGEVSAGEMSNGMMLAAFARWGKTHEPQRAYIAKTNKLNAPHFKRFAENDCSSLHGKLTRMN